MPNSNFKDELKMRVYNFARRVIKLVDNFPPKRSAHIIDSQLLRAATSIGANIIEAQAASSRRDFANFLNHSLKSGNETKFWLALSKDLDSKLIPEIEFLLQETNEITKILGSSIATIKGKRKITFS